MPCPVALHWLVEFVAAAGALVSALAAGAWSLGPPGAFVVAFVVAAALVSSVVALPSELPLHPRIAKADAAPSRHSVVFKRPFRFTDMFMYVLR
jgi:hypothetical protein